MVENALSEGSPTVGGFQSDSSPPQLRGYQIPHFCALRDSGELISESPLPICRILVENGHFAGSSTVWVDFSLIFARRNYEGVEISFFAFLRDSGELIFRIATFDVPHFGRKRSFRGIAGGEGISVRFPPSALTGVSEFPFLRFCAILKH